MSQRPNPRLSHLRHYLRDDCPSVVRAVVRVGAALGSALINIRAKVDCCLILDSVVPKHHLLNPVLSNGVRVGS